MHKPVLLIVTVSILTASWYALNLSNNKVKQSVTVAIDATNKSCNDCHTPLGISYSPSNGLLAGQGDLYLTKQLTDFAKGARKIDHLSTSIHKLTSLDIQKYSKQYALQNRYSMSSEGSKTGKQLYNRGDDERQIPACMSCHVINGHGISDATLPALSGQSFEYLVRQLELFRSSVRKNDTNDMMRKIAVRLTDEDIEALALHITSLK
ncbi:c-type cytochrome [Thalassotalea crassostreae]|uniref:c-type cytochrome n=1 Tax=Thalassotalea crassostreae TaxID=1763536 RepID=UPI0008383553|nr:c-type cytochrome [Thalassotalea crassostreae]